MNPADTLPWKRLLVKMLLRAVLDIINNPHITPKEVDDPVTFLTDPVVRSWSEISGASIPWRRINELIKVHQGDTYEHN